MGFRFVAAVCLVLTLPACTKEFSSGRDSGPFIDEAGNIHWPEASVGACSPGQDSDGDKILDDVEGCGVDTDGDGLPSFEMVSGHHRAAALHVLGQVPWE